MRMVVLIAVVATFVWILDSRQISAQGPDKPGQPQLIARGPTDAPDGTVVVSGEPAGGQLLSELRVKEQQKVGKGDIIAIQSNYHRANSALQIAEADVAKLTITGEAVLNGTRLAEIALQEAALKSAVESNKLANLQRARSPKPSDQKEIEAALAEQSLERQKLNLDLLKTKLAIDLEQHKLDLATTVGRVDSARQERETSIVRSPIDGVVLQIFTRQGERISPSGIATIVDMRQLRVLADVDEKSVGRVKPGGKVDITFQGDKNVYKGTVERIAPTVKSMQRRDTAGGTSSDSRFVQVNIMFDSPSSVIPVLGREARVAFLD